MENFLNSKVLTETWKYRVSGICCTLNFIFNIPEKPKEQDSVYQVTSHMIIEEISALFELQNFNDKNYVGLIPIAIHINLSQVTILQNRIDFFLSVQCDLFQASTYGLQPCRLLCLWGSPGNSTGVGCHFLFLGILPTQRSSPRLPCVLLTSGFFTTNASQEAHLTCSVQFSSVAQSCPTLCDPMNCSTPGLPVHHKLPLVALK